MTATAERAQSRAFTDSYFRTQLCLLVGKDTAIDERPGRRRQARRREARHDRRHQRHAPLPGRGDHEVRHRGRVRARGHPRPRRRLPVRPALHPAPPPGASRQPRAPCSSPSRTSPTPWRSGSETRSSSTGSTRSCATSARTAATPRCTRSTSGCPRMTREVGSSWSGSPSRRWCSASWSGRSPCRPEPLDFASVWAHRGQYLKGLGLTLVATAFAYAHRPRAGRLGRAGPTLADALDPAPGRPLRGARSRHARHGPADARVLGHRPAARASTTSSSSAS